MGYLGSAFFGFVVIGTLSRFWPELIAPFSFFGFWTIKGSLLAGVIGAWPIYLWAFGVTATALAIKGGDAFESPSEIFVTGMAKSLWAGIAEEVSFRWPIFLTALIMIPAADWLLLGFAGWHPVRWFYTAFLCPLANSMTLGYLEPYLLGKYGWVAGAAILTVNGRFRDGHVYLEWFGYLNSWFLGMYFFWMLFTYGLLAAIIAHFVYDAIIFTLEAIAAGLPIRRRRWA